MLRPLAFLTCFAALIAAVMALGQVLPRDDPYGPQAPSGRSYGLLAGRTDNALKVRHALATPRYDVGLFGNSRSLEVGAADLGEPPPSGVRFFNFSIGGESLRGSVALVELLATHGRLPRVVAVSVDHFEIQMYANPFYVAPDVRWLLAARDLWAGLTRSDIAFRELARMAWRWSLTEAMLFRSMFELTPFVNALSGALFGRPAFADTVGPVMHPDGSRRGFVPDSATEPTLPAVSPQVLAGYLAYDLERLARVGATTGSRIVLYESPLHPALAERAATAPSAVAHASRDRFLAECRRVGLECRTAPIRLPGPPVRWPDATHPPPANLGPYVAALAAEPLRAVAR